MKRTLAVLILTIVLIPVVITQEANTTGIKLSVKNVTRLKDAPYSKFIIPSILVSYGLITRISKPLQQLDHSVHETVSKNFPGKTRIDDYTQFTQFVPLYTLDLVGIKAAHNFRDRTFIVATSYIIMGQTVGNMKKAFGVERPDGSNKRAFPSGHTASAFVGAHILYKEYKDVSPWIGVAGYAVATGTGAMRVLNKRHWVSDIVAGAGVGMLSAEAGYLLLPVFHKLLRIKDRSNNLIIVPSIGMNNYGVGLAYSF